MSASYEGYGGIHWITPGFVWKMDDRIGQEYTLKAHSFLIRTAFDLFDGIL
jgi:hypothetical protein